MESISGFLARLGFPLRNTRWSWGARSDLGVLLTTWEDDLDRSGRYVRVLGWRAQARSPSGLKERLDHLRTLWSGGLAGYAVVARARDTKAVPRKIASYNRDSVRAILSLFAEPDGSMWAELGQDVPVRKLKKHAVDHRLVPGEGAFPVPPLARKPPRATTAAYVAKLPAMREWLIEIARKGGTVGYDEARKPFGLRTLEHRHAMERIGHACIEAGEPILTALIVDRRTGRCSQGFFKAFGCDDAQQRKDCHAFWAPLEEDGERSHAADSVDDETGEQDSRCDSLRSRAARFARTAIRPEQAAFRRRVFLAYEGACLVTGCAIPEALDAAHRIGRDWPLGHNSGADGLLLRKDIHALYDAGLVKIDEDGGAIFDPAVEAHYAGDRNRLRRG